MAGIETLKALDEYGVFLTEVGHETREAVEKQIPKKPLANAVCFPYRPTMAVYQCGRCRRRVRTSQTKDKYCPACGQKIGWELL